jgi:hypothetical protein
MFHKITVFSVDAAERQNTYMMRSLKKPCQLTVRNHISRCKVLNGYTLVICLRFVTALWRSLPPRRGTSPSTRLHWRVSCCPPVPRTGDSSILRTLRRSLPQKMARKPGPSRPRLAQPPRKRESCPRNTKGRRFWRTSPQEGTLRQVLQVVQGGGWGPSDPRYYPVSQV